jgi:hypothetical protein
MFDSSYNHIVYSYVKECSAPMIYNMHPAKSAAERQNSLSHRFIDITIPNTNTAHQDLSCPLSTLDRL